MRQVTVWMLLLLGLSGCATTTPTAPTLVPVRNEIRFSLPDEALHTSKTPPILVTEVQPKYPKRLYRAGITGMAVIHFIVDTKGRPTEVQCERANDVAFAEAAKAAVSRWVFRPAKRNGVSVPLKMVVPIQFVIRREE